VHAAALDVISPGVPFDQDMFFTSWLFYREVLTEKNANTPHLKQLHESLSYKGFIGQQMIDSSRQPDSTDINNSTASVDSPDSCDFTDSPNFGWVSNLNI